LKQQLCTESSAFSELLLYFNDNSLDASNPKGSFKKDKQTKYNNAHLFLSHVLLKINQYDIINKNYLNEVCI